MRILNEHEFIQQMITAIPRLRVIIGVPFTFPFSNASSHRFSDLTHSTTPAAQAERQGQTSPRAPPTGKTSSPHCPRGHGAVRVDSVHFQLVPTRVTGGLCEPDNCFTFRQLVFRDLGRSRECGFRSTAIQHNTIQGLAEGTPA